MPSKINRHSYNPILGLKLKFKEKAELLYYHTYSSKKLHLNQNYIFRILNIFQISIK